MAEDHSKLIFNDGRFVGNFDKYYSVCSDPWQQSRLSLYRRSDRLKLLELVTTFTEHSLVDIGCGLGFQAELLAEYASDYVGFDKSEVCIKKARRNFPNLDFRIGSFPLLDELKVLKPDTVVLSEIFWYVLDDLDEFVHFLRENMPAVTVIWLISMWPKAPKGSRVGVDEYGTNQAIVEKLGLNILYIGEHPVPGPFEDYILVLAGNYLDKRFRNAGI